jgi:hypothetical protein
LDIENCQVDAHTQPTSDEHDLTIELVVNSGLGCTTNHGNDVGTGQNITTLVIVGNDKTATKAVRATATDQHNSIMW